jgi:UDP-glucose:(heptosyl)LPS alpha-1,3-glucosyltransferase
MLVDRLCRDGHDVHLVCSRYDAAELPATIKAHLVPDFGWPRILRPWRFSSACGEVLRRERFDLSLGFDKVAGVDVLYPLGGLHQASIECSRGRFAEGWMRWLAGIFRRLDPSHISMALFERQQYLATPRPFIIAISEFVRRHFQQYLGIAEDDVAVLHAAIEAGRLSATDRPARRDRTRLAWGLGPDEVLGLFIGHNPRLKGLSQLLEAVARMQCREKFRLGVLSLKEPGGYEDEARRLGVLDNVRFLGYQPDIRDAYFAADMLVHPTFYDPCSLVVLEAQGAGLPVVTTRNNGAAELLSPPNDSLVIESANETEALASAMDRFVESEYRRSASRAAFRAAGKWTFDDHYRELMRLLGAALKRKLAA